MRKLLLPICAFLVFIFSLASHDALATNTVLKDQTSCQAASLLGTWTPANSTCAVTSLALISGDTLKVNPGNALTIRGPANNGGTINNNGIITNEGDFTNAGTLSNNGNGILTNSGTITNTYKNLIFSTGTINNIGIIYNRCAVFNNIGGLTGNPVVFFPCQGYSPSRPPSIGNDYHSQYGGGITINGKPFDIKNYHTTIPSQVLKIGNPATFGFKVYDSRGSNSIVHVGMYFPFKDDLTVINSGTWISWDKSKGVDIHDPGKIFSKSSVDLKTDDYYLDITFTMTPQKPMPDSSLIMRMWDDKLAVGDVPIWGAIVIVDPNAPVQVKKIPTDQYGDYITLENILDKDGYEIPMLLNKLHGIQAIYSSLDINWVYDKGIDKLTMVESDKSGNVLGTIECNLDKKTSQPTVTDHDYFNFTAQQLNRQDPSQEDAAKLVEVQKATKLLEELGMLRPNNFRSLTH